MKYQPHRSPIPARPNEDDLGAYADYVHAQSNDTAVRDLEHGYAAIAGAPAMPWSVDS